MKMFYLKNRCEYGHILGDIVGGIDVIYHILNVKHGQTVNKFGDDPKDNIWKDTKNDDTIDTNKVNHQYHHVEKVVVVMLLKRKINLKNCLVLILVNYLLMEYQQ